MVLPCYLLDCGVCCPASRNRRTHLGPRLLVVVVRVESGHALEPSLRPSLDWAGSGICAAEGRFQDKISDFALNIFHVSCLVNTFILPSPVVALVFLFTKLGLYLYSTSESVLLV